MLLFSLPCSAIQYYSPMWGISLALTSFMEHNFKDISLSCVSFISLESGLYLKSDQGPLQTDLQSVFRPLEQVDEIQLSIHAYIPIKGLIGLHITVAGIGLISSIGKIEFYQSKAPTCACKFGDLVNDHALLCNFSCLILPSFFGLTRFS